MSTTSNGVVLNEDIKLNCNFFYFEGNTLN